MKTAIEWLIEMLHSPVCNTFINGKRRIIPHQLILDAKEKHKKEIIDAYERGYKACDLDEALEINKTMFSGERYYEQTYKPETI
jgi:hypothetical protein